MIMDTKEVEHVALVARLELSDDETKVFVQQMNDVLDFVEILNEVDTEDVLPMIHILDTNNVFREDEVMASMDPETAVANAPEVVDNQFRVPKIM